MAKPSFIIGQCAVCNRRPGKIDAHKNRFGERDLNPDTPLGKLEKCQQCGLVVCPDCLHEKDCCFLEQDEHSDDSNWCPKVWRRTTTGYEVAK